MILSVVRGTVRMSQCLSSASVVSGPQARMISDWKVEGRAIGGRLLLRKVLKGALRGEVDDFVAL